jgi:hypothetical protein
MPLPLNRHHAFSVRRILIVKRKPALEDSRCAQNETRCWLASFTTPWIPTWSETVIGREIFARL